MQFSLEIPIFLNPKIQYAFPCPLFSPTRKFCLAIHLLEEAPFYTTEASFYWSPTFHWQASSHVCMCVCLCLEREGERENWEFLWFFFGAIPFWKIVCQWRNGIACIVVFICNKQFLHSVSLSPFFLLKITALIVTGRKSRHLLAQRQLFR